MDLGLFIYADRDIKAARNGGVGLSVSVDTPDTGSGSYSVMGAPDVRQGDCYAGTVAEFCAVVDSGDMPRHCN